MNGESSKDEDLVDLIQRVRQIHKNGHISDEEKLHIFRFAEKNLFKISNYNAYEDDELAGILKLEVNDLTKSTAQQLFDVDQWLVSSSRIPQNLPLEPLVCRNPVGIEAVLNESSTHILRELPLQSGARGSFRKPPLIFCRFARGGKTTVLCSLFDRLQSINEPSILPIILSFEPVAGFVRRKGESQSECLLRHIAVQFLELTPYQKGMVVCSSESLDRFLTSLQRPVVLLVDDLSGLGKGQPVDKEVYDLLAELFLDPPGRYLVLTSTAPVPLEAPLTGAAMINRAPSLSVLAIAPSSPSGGISQLVVPSSPSSSVSGRFPPSPLSKAASARIPAASTRTNTTRNTLVVGLPTCTDLAKLQKLVPNDTSFSTASEELTPAEVALYGGVPSLIYSVKQLSYRPETRFNQFVTSAAPLIADSFLKNFVMEFLDGKAAHADVRQFDIFASSVEEGRVRWPLCYVRCILNQVRTVETVELVAAIDALEALAKTRDGGSEWELVVRISVLFHLLNAKLNGKSDPFGLVPRTCPVNKILIDTLSPQIQTLHAAKSFMDTRLQSCKEATIFFVVPSYPDFPDVDALMCFKESASSAVTYVGYQAKTIGGGGKPRKNIPAWVDKAFYIRGDAAASSEVDGKWVYMGADEIERSLLGYSMSALYPAPSWCPSIKVEAK